MYKSSEISTIKDCDIDNPEAEKSTIINETEKPKNINLNDNVDDENSITEKNTNKT